jgi:hypothetical protein
MSRGRPRAELTVSESDRQQLEALVGSRSLPSGLARIIHEAQERESGETEK